MHELPTEHLGIPRAEVSNPTVRERLDAAAPAVLGNRARGTTGPARSAVDETRVCLGKARPGLEVGPQVLIGADSADADDHLFRSEGGPQLRDDGDTPLT